MCTEWPLEMNKYLKRPQRRVWHLVIILAWTVGCGADDNMSSPPVPSGAECPTVFDVMPQTRALFDSGRLLQLRTLIASDLSDAQVSALIDALLSTIRSLSPQEIDAIGSLLRQSDFDSLSRTLSALLAFLGGTPDGSTPFQSEVIEATRRLITICDGGKILAAVSATLTSNELPTLLQDLASMLENFELQLAFERQGQLQRDGFAALVCNASNRLARNDFSVQNDIIQPLNALGVSRLDEPPLNRLLRNLDSLLAPDRPLRSALSDTICCNLYDLKQCLDVGPRDTVIDRPPAFAWATYDGLTQASPMLPGRLKRLSDFIVQPDVVAALIPLRSALGKLAENDAVEVAITSTLRVILAPGRAETLLRELKLLVDAGFVEEVLAVIQLVARGCERSF